jgi:hypothetical protein
MVVASITVESSDSCCRSSPDSDAIRTLAMTPKAAGCEMVDRLILCIVEYDGGEDAGASVD